MPLKEAYEYYGTQRGAIPNYVNGYAVQSLAYSVPFDARGAADTITVPALIVHSERALAPDLAREFYTAVRSPKQSFGSRLTARSTFTMIRRSLPLQRMPSLPSGRAADVTPLDDSCQMDSSRR